MKTLTIIKYQWQNLLRARWIIGYMLIYLLLTDALIRFGGSGEKAMLSISNVMLLFVPIISMLYGALFLYQSREFIELLLAQPLKRKHLYSGLYFGLTIPLTLAYVLGISVPMIYFGLAFTGTIYSLSLILALGAALTFLFTALGFVFALTYFDEKIKGLGFTLITWLFLAILYDGLILLMINMLGDYPIEQPILAVSLLNPIDLSRILILLNFDISALMGYTGAAFNQYFGSVWGIIISTATIVAWMGVSSWRGYSLFLKKDF